MQVSEKRSMVLRVLFTFIVFTVYTAFAGGSVPLVTRPCEFVYKRAHFAGEFPIAASQSDSNFQQHIWHLRTEGKLSEAQQLEEEVVKILNGKFSTPVDIKQGAAGGRYYPFALDVVGVGKKSGRHWSSSVESEVAAYQVDRLYGFSMTPITISREAENGFLSMQLFYKDAAQARLGQVKALETDLQKMKIFDYLIDNFDRRDTNYLINKYGRVIAIDHGVSFHNARAVQFSPHAPKLEELELSFFQTQEGQAMLSKLRSIKNSEISEYLGNFLNEKEIQKFIVRKEALLNLINKKL